MGLTVVTMLIEIIFGLLTGSMALLADGWHMATHAAAFAITLFAYSYARKNRDNPRFTFGTGKVNVLGGFASAIALGVVAVLMISESTIRFISPEDIIFDQAIAVAVVGLIINLACAKILHQDGHHHHDHHDHAHNHDHHDHNLKAAYLHVLADAMTSVFAIVALVAGKYWGLIWMDALMGVVGACVIIKWSVGLIKDTAGILLDAGVSDKTRDLFIEHLRKHDISAEKIFLWQTSPGHYAVTLKVSDKVSREAVREACHSFRGMEHVALDVSSSPTAHT